MIPTNSTHTFFVKGDPGMSVFDALLKPDIHKREERKDIQGLLTIAASTTDNDSRRKAVQALGRLNDPVAILPLTRMVSDRVVRNDAIRAIAKIQAPESMQTLCHLLSNENSDVRITALHHIKPRGDTSAIPALVNALYDKDIRIRQGSAEILDALGWEPGKDRAGAYYWAAKGRFEKTAELGEESIDIIKNFIAIQENHDTCCGFHYIKDPKAVNRLISLFHYRACFYGYHNSDVEKAAIRALGTIGDTRAVDPLVALLTVPPISDGRADVRREAIKALGKIRDPRAVDPLIGFLKNERGFKNAYLDEYAHMAGDAAEALGEIGDPRAIVPLIESLGDQGSSSHEQAAKALGRFKDARAVEPLIAALKSRKSAEAGIAIMDALGTIGDERAGELLHTISSENSEKKWDDYTIDGSDFEYDGFLKSQGLGRAARSAMDKIQGKTKKNNN
jgi:HEAT repeat protein